MCSCRVLPADAGTKGLRHPKERVYDVRMTNTTTVSNPLSDEALAADLTSGMPGTERRARILLGVPVAHRAVFSAEARYVGNMVGGRPSDNLASAVRNGLGRLTSPMAQRMAAAL
jgi:hypothetical protein